jgi:hypothetical protein
VNIQELNKEARLREWAEMVSACRNSGLTVGAWCKENGISVKSYYYRLKRICNAAGNKPEMQRRGKVVSASLERVTEFAEIGPVDCGLSQATAITVQIRNAQIQIHNGADASVIEATLRVLKNIC